MSETPEQQLVAETQQPVADQRDYQTENEVLKAQNHKVIGEKKAFQKQVEDLQRQMQDLQSRDQQRMQADLLANGKAEELVDQLRGTVGQKDARIAELEAQLQEKDVAFQQQQIKASALNALSQSGVVNPDQAFSLLKENLRLKDGVPIALAGGVEVPLQQHLESLRTPGSGWEHHFAGSGARGMSAAGSSSSSSGQKSWASMGLMERMQLMEDNLPLAEQLKAAG